MPIKKGSATLAGAHMNQKPEKQISHLRRYGLPLFSIAMVLVLGSLGTALAAATTFYLKATGVPEATLSEAAPSAGTLGNYDPSRDDAPGLLIQKGGSGLGETDPTKYQLWLAAPSELTLDGPATFTFWAAMKDFATDKKGQVRAFLLDCGSSGTDCVEIDSGVRTGSPWSSQPDWAQRTFDFGTVQHTVAAGRSLAVKLVVTSQSQDDMWFAYDTSSYPSVLKVQLGSPPPTTTTTTTTTSTTVPPATTTTTTSTTAPPATTTTTIPVGNTSSTTTTIPVGNAPSTTTTAVPSTTTEPPDSTPEAATTTTTIPDPPEPQPAAADPAPPDEDVALAPLPDSTSGDGSGGLSNLLLDGLELVIPPAVASSLLSPLLLLESVFGAFVETGRGLLLPGLLLVVGVLWTEGRRRRDNVLIATVIQDRVQP